MSSSSSSSSSSLAEILREAKLYKSKTVHATDRSRIDSSAYLLLDRAPSSDSLCYVGVGVNGDVVIRRKGAANLRFTLNFRRVPKFQGRLPVVMLAEPSHQMDKADCLCLRVLDVLAENGKCEVCRETDLPLRLAFVPDCLSTEGLELLKAQYAPCSEDGLQRLHARWRSTGLVFKPKIHSVDFPLFLWTPPDVSRSSLESWFRQKSSPPFWDMVGDGFGFFEDVLYSRHLSRQGGEGTSEKGGEENVKSDGLVVVPQCRSLFPPMETVEENGNRPASISVSGSDGVGTGSISHFSTVHQFGDAVRTVLSDSANLTRVPESVPSLMNPFASLDVEQSTGGTDGVLQKVLSILEGFWGGGGLSLSVCVCGNSMHGSAERSQVVRTFLRDGTGADLNSVAGLRGFVRLRGRLPPPSCPPLSSGIYSCRVEDGGGEAFEKLCGMPWGISLGVGGERGSGVEEVFSCLPSAVVDTLRLRPKAVVVVGESFLADEFCKGSLRQKEKEHNSLPYSLRRLLTEERKGDRVLKGAQVFSAPLTPSEVDGGVRALCPSQLSALNVLCSNLAGVCEAVLVCGPFVAHSCAPLRMAFEDFGFDLLFSRRLSDFVECFQLLEGESEVMGEEMKKGHLSCFDVALYGKRRRKGSRAQKSEVQTQEHDTENRTDSSENMAETVQVPKSPFQSSSQQQQQTSPPMNLLEGKGPWLLRVCAFLPFVGVTQVERVCKSWRDSLRSAPVQNLVIRALPDLFSSPPLPLAGIQRTPASRVIAACAAAVAALEEEKAGEGDGGERETGIICPPPPHALPMAYEERPLRFVPPDFFFRAGPSTQAVAVVRHPSGLLEVFSEVQKAGGKDCSGIIALPPWLTGPCLGAPEERRRSGEESTEKEGEEGDGSSFERSFSGLEWEGGGRTERAPPRVEDLPASLCLVLLGQERRRDYAASVLRRLSVATRRSERETGREAEGVSGIPETAFALMDSSAALLASWTVSDGMMKGLMRRASNLEHLVLHGIQFEDSTLRSLGESCPRLQSIELSGYLVRQVTTPLDELRRIHGGDGLCVSHLVGPSVFPELRELDLSGLRFLCRYRERRDRPSGPAEASSQGKGEEESVGEPSSSSTGQNAKGSQEEEAESGWATAAGGRKGKGRSSVSRRKQQPQGQDAQTGAASSSSSVSVSVRVEEAPVAEECSLPIAPLFQTAAGGKWRLRTLVWGDALSVPLRASPVTRSLQVLQLSLPLDSSETIAQRLLVCPSFYR
uniref:F-box domain-containing protein n=1 Tax=Chromera velia CCMP2878 TaxID=1169474 RepID=A0A0G4HQP0_9ALVE|eukprot:Cvel_30193.t1-p1 / transcript=Cvel_30193.t1 / gene=Cvel_30193 / organism=Chromera_velia_CCMP2878 / gene_product=hypothetical protein / transcript_product=hypothetical protein / location=Cvel_scaffold4270:290-6069(-) / protein_length=1245 / sequence_SO=supercontig / SO=protein_coding / is_pseudo=false